MYIENTHGLKSIPDGYKQIFRNKFTNNISKTEILRMKEEDILTNRDLEIVSFLYDFKFATLDQIYRYLKIKGVLTQKKFEEGEEVRETSINSIRGRLDKLVLNRVLNKFSLSLYDDKIQPDAMIFYCVDLGGKFLLSNYSTKDVLEWHFGLNLKTSSLISKDVATTQFYLEVLDKSNDDLEYFITTPLRKCDKMNIIPNGEFLLTKNGGKKFFLVEVIREFDSSIDIKNKMNKLDMIFSTNAWKKYYYEDTNPPILFVLCENEELALHVGRLIHNGTTIDRFRLTTDEKLVNDDLSVAFMKYLGDEDTLKNVKINIF